MGKGLVLCRESGAEIAQLAQTRFVVAAADEDEGRLCREADAEKAAGLVKRETNTQSIDHKYLASQQGLFGADAEAFSKRFEETLAREMASFQEKGRSQLVTSSESFMISYAGHFNRAVATAAEQFVQADLASRRGSIPESGP